MDGKRTQTHEEIIDPHRRNFTRRIFFRSWGHAGQGLQEEHAGAGGGYERQNHSPASYVDNCDYLRHASIQGIQSRARDKDYRERPTRCVEQPRYGNGCNRHDCARRSNRRNNRREVAGKEITGPEDRDQKSESCSFCNPVGLFISAIRVIRGLFHLASQRLSE